MKIKSIFASLFLALAASAQTNVETFVKGTLNINYASRTSPSAKDVYTLDMNVANSANFGGSITYTPLVKGLVGISQPASLSYEIACDVINPKKPEQRRNVGRIYGAVPISPEGIYNFNNGSLRIGVVGMGSARAFEGKFGGHALGRPLIKADGWLDKLKNQAVNIQKTVNGKTITLSVKKYDKMSYRSHVLAQGPVQMYPEATVNGDMLYDYSRYVWYFQNVTVSYFINGRQVADRLTGNIRWVESPNRKANGEGEYQFDIRVNEPPPSESAIFAVASDESAFFETDSSIPSMTGAMKYKDTMQGETVTASAVQVDLQGNKLTKEQAMNIFKLVMLTSIVPINAE